MTEILLIGINHKTAPVEVREKLAFSENELLRALAFCKAQSAVIECVILSTCNRTEIYVAGESEDLLLSSVMEMLTHSKGINAGATWPSLYIHSGQTAIQHLFNVTSGLDSMVLGETQILGQVKDAYAKANEAGTVYSVFHSLFRHAVTAAKRVQTETAINQNAASVSYAAVELAKKIFGSLNDRTVMILGAGKMSELTLRLLFDSGAKQVVVINRTKERADKLAAAFGGRSEYYEKRHEFLNTTDIVISSTGAPHYVLLKKELAQVMRARRGKPIFLIDIAVPRDIDPAINELDNVYLYDIDDLQAVVAANMKDREHESVQARSILQQEISEYQLWYKTREVTPLIAALRQKAETIRKTEVEATLRRLSHLSDKEKKHVDNLTRAVVNRILREPVLRIKEFALEDNRDIYIASLCQLFDLETNVSIDSQETAQVQLPKWQTGGALHE